MTRINIILLGESGVGKTTLLLRFQTGEFPRPDSAKITCGVEFQVKKLNLDGNDVTLFIWDTAGEERHRSVVRSYYRQGEGVLLVYDVTNLESYYRLADWLRELRNANEKTVVLIAGNKDEGVSKKKVAVSTVKNFAKEENLEYMEMSAKTGKNVEEAFHYLAKKILIAKGILADPQDNSSGIYGKIIPKKIIPDKEHDIIRLEATPVEKPKKNKKCC